MRCSLKIVIGRWPSSMPSTKKSTIFLVGIVVRFNCTTIRGGTSQLRVIVCMYSAKLSSVSRHFYCLHSQRKLIVKVWRDLQRGKVIQTSSMCCMELLILLQMCLTSIKVQFIEPGCKVKKLQQHPHEVNESKLRLPCCPTMEF